MSDLLKQKLEKEVSRPRTVSVQLPPELWSKINAIVWQQTQQNQDVTISAVIRALLELGIERLGG